MKKMPVMISRLFMTAVVGLTYISVSRAESVKADPLAARGCIAKISKEQALTVMRRFHMHSMHGKSTEIRTVGTALLYIEKLNGGKPLKRATAKVDDNYSFEFRDAHRNSHQASNEIRVNRNGSKNYGENVAQLVHELGHYIGNNGGYEAYYDAVGGRRFCKVSSYSEYNFHEQFAEVFAAFVTRPAFIKRNPSPTCRKAFKFFSTVIFADAAGPQLKCMAHQDALLAAASPEKQKANSTPINKPVRPSLGLDLSALDDALITAPKIDDSVKPEPPPATKPAAKSPTQNKTPASAPAPLKAAAPHV